MTQSRISAALESSSIYCLDIHLFLAAMSSSRSDDVTKCVCLCVCLCVRSQFVKFAGFKAFEAKCLEGVSGVSFGSFKGVPRNYQGSFKGANRKFQGCFKGVSRMFQGRFRAVLSRTEGQP